jgi:hypothetical protein
VDVTLVQLDPGLDGTAYPQRRTPVEEWRQLVLNIFRVDNSYIHQISTGLLIGSITFLIPAPLSPHVVMPAKELRILVLRP